MEGGHGIGRRNKQPDRIAAEPAPAEGEGCGGSDQESDELGELDGGYVAGAQQAKEHGNVEAERGVVVEEGVSVAVVGVGHPAGREVAVCQGGAELVEALEQKGAIAAAAGVEQAGAGKEGNGGDHRDQQSQEQRAVRPHDGCQGDGPRRAPGMPLVHAPPQPGPLPSGEAQARCRSSM